MKLMVFIPFLFSLVLLAGCASTEPAANEQRTGSSTEMSQEHPDDAISDDKDFYQNLGDYLQRIPGVNLTGGVVTIRGISSFNSGIEPLFVIDGQIVGSSYTQANNMINPREIDYVRVLKGPDAAIYGVRGGNGVVLITTKK
ncbi:MAG: TonB-dependent receptor plug domain-containing protein [Balneolaceae bacterium]